MGSKERKERERDQRRELILSAASEIVSREGIGKLSIRKIANQIEYSPAIIYHYFRDKEEILEHLLHMGYQKILNGFALAIEKSDNPRDRIIGLAQNYINQALQNPEEYRNFMLNDSPRVLEQTAVLFQGAAAKRPAVGMLCQAIKELCPQDCPAAQIELTAQVIWASIFGLILRLIIENDLPEKQRQKLIAQHTNIVLNGMIPAGCKPKPLKGGK